MSKKFPVFTEPDTWLQFVTNPQFSPPYSKWIQHTHSQYIFFRCILILFYNLRLSIPSVFFLQIFRSTVSTQFIMSFVRAKCAVHRFSWSDHPNNIWWSLHAMELLVQPTVPNIMNNRDGETKCGDVTGLRAYSSRNENKEKEKITNKFVDPKYKPRPLQQHSKLIIHHDHLMKAQLSKPTNCCPLHLTRTTLHLLSKYLSAKCWGMKIRAETHVTAIDLTATIHKV
jgi:hypothetical protein